MLIVGTNGRSAATLRNLMINRDSFSRWCLQNSPIPVVVVRPDDKREKKKRKRDHDPTRQSYKQVLNQAGVQIHETDAEPESSFARVGVLGLNPEEEAHAVAAELGLRSSFDHQFLQPAYRPGIGDPKHTYFTVQSPYQSEAEESSDSEEEDEIEATMVSGLNGEGAAAKRNRLHAMETAEAQALAGRKSSVTSTASDETDDGDVSGLGRAGIMWTI